MTVEELASQLFDLANDDVASNDDLVMINIAGRGTNIKGVYVDGDMPDTVFIETED